MKPKVLELLCNAKLSYPYYIISLGRQILLGVISCIYTIVIQHSIPDVCT